MGLRSTLYADGVEVKNGSTDAVRLYETALREADAKLDEAKALLAVCPDAVAGTWRKQHEKVAVSLGRLTGPVGRFRVDFEARGLDSAVLDGRHRGEVN
jgi:hypothetical protein